MKNKISLTILLIISLTIIFTLFACTPDDDRCNHGNHAFVEWQPNTTDRSVFCQNRTYSSVCSLCGKVGTAKGGMGWHEDITERLEPTCIAEGYDKTTCAVCDYSNMYIIPIDASAHQCYDTYYSDAINHWKMCQLCDAVLSRGIHKANEEQYCETCGYFIGPSIGIVYEISEDGSYAMVTDYLSGISSIEIAQYYEDIPVKVIKEDAFKDERIVSIIIPNGVTTIENGAFMGSKLKSITLPDSITTIGDNAFKGCTNLRELTLSCNVATIGSGAFEGCTALTKITIPDGIEVIGNRVFYGCTSVTKIEFGSTVTSIGSSAFENCSSISDVIIPDSVVSIGDGAFRNCTQLEKLSGCGGLKNVGRYAFDNCHSYLYGESLQGKYVMVKNHNTWAILIEHLDKDCWDGHQVIDRAKIIASGAYDQSYYLTSIVISEGVIAISDEAFADCQSLTSIYYMGTSEAWKNVTIGTGNDYLINATVEYHQ